jgi:hypothetical protein
MVKVALWLGHAELVEQFVIGARRCGSPPGASAAACASSLCGTQVMSVPAMSLTQILRYRAVRAKAVSLMLSAA